MEARKAKLMRTIKKLDTTITRYQLHVILLNIKLSKLCDNARHAQPYLQTQYARDRIRAKKMIKRVTDNIQNAEDVKDRMQTLCDSFDTVKDLNEASALFKDVDIADLFTKTEERIAQIQNSIAETDDLSASSSRPVNIRAEAAVTEDDLMKELEEMMTTTNIQQNIPAIPTSRGMRVPPTDARVVLPAPPQ